MAMVTGYDYGGYYEDSMAGKMKYVFDRLRHQYPDLKIRVNPNPPGGDYTELMFEGIGLMRISNTESVTLSPQELATKMETFVRGGMPKVFRQEFDGEFKKPAKPSKPLTPAEEFAEEWARKNKK